MNAKRLYAKSWIKDASPPASAFLAGHLRDVHEAARQVLDATVGMQLEAMGLLHASCEQTLRRVVTLAAALHDLGKCNDQFQAMLDGSRHGQTLRHEWATLLILNRPGWQAWLLPAVGGDERMWQAVRWCIAGHHPAYDRLAPPEPGDGPAIMRFPMDHPDMKKAMRWLERTFQLAGDWPDADPFEIDFVGVDESLEQLYRNHYEDEDAFEDENVWSSEWRRLLAAAKNTLVAADVAGSALPREVEDGDARSKWVSMVLSPQGLPCATDYEDIVNKRLNGDQLRPFQKATAEQAGRVTLLRAGCGTGKTLAAYHWAARHCDGRRLFVCYPTTGTATEGFRDYLLDPPLASDAEKLRTDLAHSRRKIDFQHFPGTADENRATGIARIESLDLWRTPVVACTVDAVLGLVQNNRRGLMSWPAIAQGGFVFDEIHAYDTKLFDALLHFLDTMRGVPVLLMTASLPEYRLQAIQAVVEDRDDGKGRKDRLIEVAGPESEAWPRYQIEHVDGKAVVDRIREELATDGKVLRVCNTVRRAMDLCDDNAAGVVADSLAELAPLIYHSRFRYCDRVKRHDAVIRDFKSDDRALAVCTQVAEMSLDLSATLLVTDLAPVPALIQRLGRLNRHADKGDRVRPFIVVEPLGADGKPQPLPYREDELEQAREWLKRLGEGELSQADLARAWEQLQTEAETPLPTRGESAWLDFGPATPVLELREGSPGITVVLERDRSALKEGKVTLAEVAVPMPIPPPRVGDKRFEWQVKDYNGPAMFNGVPIARQEAVDYDEQRGAKWRVV